ncbi:hypothetical protein F5X99DRAFT_408461 [Biscogniauxia marginata]|nr:hypothetical protein F5X99DRAFT_408461 [Biscogniauxia marginata]
MSVAALLAFLLGLLYRTDSSVSNGAAHIDRATAGQTCPKPVELPAAYASFYPFYPLRPVFEQTGSMTLQQLMNLFPAATLPRWTRRV